MRVADGVGIMLLEACIVLKMVAVRDCTAVVTWGCLDFEDSVSREMVPEGLLRPEEPLRVGHTSVGDLSSH